MPDSAIVTALKMKYIFLCVAVSLISSFLVLYIFYNFTADTAFYDSDSCLNFSDAQFCYFSKNGIWSDSSYLQTITGFYSAIITVLIGIIAIVATVGAYTIKASIRAQAEQEMPGVVDKHFKHQDGQGQVRTIVEEKMEAKIGEIRQAIASLPIPQTGPLSEMLASIERRLESMEEFLNEEVSEE